MKKVEITIKFKERSNSIAVTNEAFVDFEKQLGVLAEIEIIEGKEKDFLDDCCIEIIVKAPFFSELQLTNVVGYLIGSIEGHSMYNFSNKIGAYVDSIKHFDDSRN